MRVTLFGYLSPNPYLFIYKETLERQGFIVNLEYRFSLKWLVTKGKSCDVIHLHWIELAYQPPFIRLRLVRRLMKHRFLKALRGALWLANFSAALFLTKLRGKTIIYTVHNLSPHDQEFWPFVVLRRIAHHVVLSLSDHIHAHNHYTRKILETAYKKDGVIVVPLGNYVGYYPNQLSRLEARRQLSLPNDAFVYLFLGLIRPYKGVEELIDAFEKLELPMGQLLIVGRALNASYKEKISSLNQNNPAIRLVLEHVPDEAIQLYMNACDICVLPYVNVTTSSAAVLALSFGRPVIVPAIAAFPELVTPETGILYDPSQPSALVSALQQAREGSWSESEILDYVHRFDWDNLWPQLANLYRIESS
jgi:glycosyltransferase involved in cell wall biosynthesis